MTVVSSCSSRSLRSARARARNAPERLRTASLQAAIGSTDERDEGADEDDGGRVGSRVMGSPRARWTWGIGGGDDESLLVVEKRAAAEKWSMASARLMATCRAVDPGRVRAVSSARRVEAASGEAHGCVMVERRVRSRAVLVSKGEGVEEVEGQVEEKRDVH